MPVDFLVSLRPKHWIKNLFVFAALIFAKKFTDPQAIAASLAAFALFCLAASGIYLINDVVDYKNDREHPFKRNRPIASGKISRFSAGMGGALMLIVSLGFALLVSYYFFIALAGYVLLNVLYSVYFKKIVILDVISIALGFVIRVIAGAVVIGVVFSSWLMLCTFFLTLFLGIGKRKNEMIALNGALAARGVLEFYSVDLLNQMNMVVAPSTLITYTLYTFNSGHSEWLVATVPVVLYGLFRYLYIVDRKRASDNGPTDDLLLDRNLQITIGVWIVMVILILTIMKK